MLHSTDWETAMHVNEGGRDLLSDAGEREFIRVVFENIKFREKREDDELRDMLSRSPVPISDELLRTITRRYGERARAILQVHPGHETLTRVGSYERTLKLFQRCAGDLLRAIDNFKGLAKDSSLFGRHREAELDEIELGIQKELFTTINVAHALVDHTRRLHNHVQIPNYAERLQEAFGDSGLRQFIIALRTVIHHRLMIMAGWSQSKNFVTGDTAASFQLSKPDLLLAFEAEKRASKLSTEQYQGALRYLREQSDRVDLTHVFTEYHNGVAQFHSGVAELIASSHLILLRDYERCQKEVRNSARRDWWRLMLSNWLNSDAPPNPFDHLHKYLSPEQFREVMKLPRSSKGQVDRIIHYVDKEGACTAEIRQLAYNFFRRAA